MAVPQRLERSGFILKKVIRSVVLGDVARVHHQYAGGVDDGVQAVRDGEHGALGELGTNHALYQTVRLRVDGGGGLHVVGGGGGGGEWDYI